VPEHLSGLPTILGFEARRPDEGVQRARGDIQNFGDRCLDGDQTDPVLDEPIDGLNDLPQAPAQPARCPKLELLPEQLERSLHKRRRHLNRLSG
jgi:hypothetical protein